MPALVNTVDALIFTRVNINQVPMLL